MNLNKNNNTNISKRLYDALDFQHEYGHHPIGSLVWIVTDSYFEKLYDEATPVYRFDWASSMSYGPDGMEYHTETGKMNVYPVPEDTSLIEIENTAPVAHRELHGDALLISTNSNGMEVDEFIRECIEGKQ